MPVRENVNDPVWVRYSPSIQWLWPRLAKERVPSRTCWVKIKAGALGAVAMGHNGEQGAGNDADKGDRLSRHTELLPTLTLTVFSYQQSSILRHT